MPFEFGGPRHDTATRIAHAAQSLDAAAAAWRDSPENTDSRRTFSEAILGMERLYAHIRLKLARVALAAPSSIAAPASEQAPLPQLAENLAGAFNAWQTTHNTAETQGALAGAVADMERLTTRMKHDLAARTASLAGDPRVIATSAALADFCAMAATRPFIAVDTEFMRTDTYYSKACLIQIAISPTEAVAVDPLAPGIDLSPLDELMANPSVIKVFHAAQADIEIFHDRSGRVPKPVFDTQVAAGMCGFGNSAGYKALAKDILGIDVDKETCMTDWAARPLLPRQVDYAIGDVTHLCAIYEHLHAKLAADGRLEKARGKMGPLANPQKYIRTPHATWPRPRLRDGSRRIYAAHRALWIWRETEAQKLDVPRSRILRDNVFMDIATRIPQTAEDLAAIDGLPQGFAEGKMGKSLLAALASVDENCAATSPNPHGPRPA